VDSQTTSITVEGSIDNSGIRNLPWFPKNGGSLSIPMQGGKRILALGLNEPNNPHGVCQTSFAGDGSCRHLHHCLQPAYFNFFTFLSNVCIIGGRYIGVCCPNPATTTTATTTTTTTRRPPIPTSSSSPLRSCGANKKRFQTRIVGGRPADPEEWPWLAALIHKQGRGSGQYCGATLISDTHVITAAHCIAPFKKEDIFVKLGEYDFSVEGETKDKSFQVLSINMHTQYNNITFENDIAMLKLDQPVPRTSSIYPICLPEPGEDFTNTGAHVIGWGTIEFGGPVSDILQEVKVNVWDSKKCADNYKKLGRTVLPTMMCAGAPRKDSCQGDSGGPLNCKDRLTGLWKLCGIVSWGAKCAEEEFPGVYTRVTEYLDWIHQNSV